MPPKKGKKKTKDTKKKVRKTQATIQASQYGNLIKAIGDLRGTLMSRNTPIPGSSQFVPFIGTQDQAVNVIRANASNTIARAERELSDKLSRETQKILQEQTVKNLGFQTPEPSMDFLRPKTLRPKTEEEEDTLSRIYQDIYEQTGGKGMSKIVKGKKKVVNELLETVPEGGFVQAGISMNVPGQTFGMDRGGKTPFELIEETRKTTPSAFFKTPPYRRARKAIEKPLFENETIEI